MSGEKHEMHLVEEHAPGIIEFACELCGRRLLMQWHPEYKKVVLQPGNEEAIHTGSQGGIQFSTAQITDKQEQQLTEADEQLLSPWVEALKKIDF